jgi:hypothetical protein
MSELPKGDPHTPPTSHRAEASFSLAPNLEQTPFSFADAYPVVTLVFTIDLMGQHYSTYPDRPQAHAFQGTCLF